MPFNGILNDEVVWPDDVDDAQTVTCPECEDQMHVRSGHVTADGVHKPRCFAHNPDATLGGMCSGGESDRHKLMKYVASRTLNNIFDHADVHREKQIQGTPRIADVVAEFTDSIERHGRGVVAEVQHKNQNKDVEAVTREYLRAGYSVYWLNESHFGEEFETVEMPDMVPVWPNAVPTPGEWSGVEEPVSQLNQFGSRYPIHVKLPPEHLENEREELKKRWRMAAGEYDFDLVYNLSENNAPRRCAVCGEEASYYLFQDGVISTFRCDEHPTDSSVIKA